MTRERHPTRSVIERRKTDDIVAEVRAAFAAIMDAIPPLPPEVSNAFLVIGAAGLLILVVSILNICEANNS